MNTDLPLMIEEKLSKIAMALAIIIILLSTVRWSQIPLSWFHQPPVCEYHCR